jgi:hypothetical protein
MRGRDVFATVVIAAASSAVTMFAMYPPPPVPVREASAGSWSNSDEQQADRWEDLQRRLASLESQVRAPTPVVAANIDRTDATVVPARDLEEVAARLAVLEARFNALETRRELGDAADPTSQPEPLPDRGVAERWILDPNETVARKLRAHEALRRVKDAYTPAMAEILVRIGATDLDGQVRADVWRFFDGYSRLPQLVTPLLAALAVDAEAKVREEAVETLGNYQDDPRVRLALEATIRGDGDSGVRDKAKRTLGERGSAAANGNR